MDCLGQCRVGFFLELREVLVSCTSVDHAANGPPKNAPEALFAALKDLIAEGRVAPARLEVRFYGPEAGWVESQASRYGIEGLVKQFGIVRGQDALNRQRESQLLLLLKWNDPREKGTYSGKVFEYLAARRPVLAVGGYRDVVSDLLDETKAGSEGSTAEDVKRILRGFLDEYRAAGRL